MKILVDTHTHTNCSTHAHSTLIENANFAKMRGLEMLCTTDHTPALPDAAHLWHFRTIVQLPREYDGLKLLYGAEVNILDKNGNIDLPREELEMMDMIVASIHTPCYMSGTDRDCTSTYLGVIDNPYVNIIGHSGSPSYPYDIERVVKAAKENNKCIEINNHSYSVRPDNAENCRKIALACKKIGTNIVVSSDAHSAFDVGVFDTALEMLCDIDFPEELIVNSTAEKFEKYLEKFKK